LLIDALFLVTRDPRRPGLLPEASVELKPLRAGHSGVTEAGLWARGDLASRWELASGVDEPFEHTAFYVKRVKRGSR